MHSKEVGKSWADQMQEQDFHGPKEGILLDPLTDRILSPSDLGLIEGDP